MDALGNLLLACAVFLATHGVASTPLRARLVAALGERGYLGLYSAVALAALGWMILAYSSAPYIALWQPGALRWLPAALMPLATTLVASGLMARNPALIGQEHALRAAEPARGILRVTRHPVMWGIALWAALHVAARGDLAALVFFGSFLALAAGGTALIDARRRAALGPVWERYAAATSNVPFAAILSRRNRLAPAEIGCKPLAAGLALYLALLAAHEPLIGARPY
ncbi:MAG TPA: NnrU family protein [Burkholderiales bacterium]|nr:NnrU family protein [Burkholderiales bacterium]